MTPFYDSFEEIDVGCNNCICSVLSELLQMKSDCPHGAMIELDAIHNRGQQ